ncbi:hypothetical protein J4226_04135 [Candidatus Pacearchaeota archaeon]|nr:hypothetical protein [Candidatus Pacearchaeota archaeon]
MQKINLENLKIMDKTIKEKFPNKSNDFYKMMLSTEFLRIIIDNDWLNKSVFANFENETKKTMEAREFLRSKEINLQWMERVSRLSERLFNLQNIIGIEDVIKKIKEGNFLSRFAEIEVGTHFYRRGIPFEFIIPSGEKEKDFDIVINYNTKINCEIKHKIESTELSRKTLMATLKKAKEQMPKNNPSIISIKIPESWTLQKEISEIFLKALSDFFSNSNNDYIVGILFRWESRSLFNSGLFFWKYKLEKNTNSKLYNKDIQNILERIDAPATKWIDFKDVVEGRI